MENLGKLEPAAARPRPLGRVCQVFGLALLLFASNSSSRAATLHTNAVFDVSLTLNGYYQDIRTFVVGPTSAVFYLTALPASVGTAELVSAISSAVPPQFSGG